MSKHQLLAATAIVAFLLLIGACRQHSPERQPAAIDFGQLPLKKLSEYGLFKGDMKAMQPADGVVLYEPVAALFTDYAFKKRFVWMPKGTSATFGATDTDGALDFPDHTILVKNFYYPEDFSKPEGARRILETRLLVKNNGKWDAYPYRWNDEQTEAAYKITGESIPVNWRDEAGTAHHLDYAMPNKNQCKSCHNQGDVFVPIGPKVKQLNHAITYADGTTENQLEHWKKIGYLRSTEGAASIKTLTDYRDTAAPLADRARSYLDVNCGHCHSRRGPASTSGLYLSIEEQSPAHWGILKSPVAAGIGSGPHKFDIYPGHADESIFVYRMNSVHPGVMMPEIGRVSIHAEGVALIRAWINSLKG